MLSTVHGSKGLEWDYVILPDMERSSFPSFLGLCKECMFGKDCHLDWQKIAVGSKFDKLFHQEINIFMWLGLCARKKVYFTYSHLGINSRGEPRDNNISCFVQLPGLQMAK